ncbi:MAG: amidase [Anaerolineales bacterium]|nr:amidase [Anaerolineales bacterium]MCB0012444.1 amidase [Anaerolineales bacterium]MCB0018552.1 amidase [Anaerolineales bacterium]MCB8961898.1 amidase [Ardenticatenales bacterium]
MSELLTLDAVGQAALVRRGEISPVELVDAAIAQIERLNPQLNAVITPLYAGARAKALDPALPDGPFRGVPLLLKDFFCETADDPYFMGMGLLRDLAWRAQQDTYLAAKFREAGFIFLGKTNLPELAGGAVTEPEAFGPTRNPWNLRFSPAGSSGGSAAAVAARMTAVAHANDGLGSIRIPAGCCGLVGLKPSRGRVSTGPGRPAGLLENIVEFVVSRTVRDTAAVLDAVAGRMPGDRFFAPPPERPYQEEVGAPQAPLRVGLLVEHPYFPLELHPDILEAVEQTGRFLAALGHEVEYAYPAILGGATGLGLALRMVSTSGAAATLDRLSEQIGRPIGPADVESGTWTWAEEGRKYTAVQIHQAYDRLARGAAALLAWWQEGYDLLVSPLMAQPGILVGEKDPAVRQAAFGIFAMAFSITGQPALTLPIFWNEDNLPVAVQLVADMHREDLLIRLAAQLEAVNPWLGHWPTPLEVA